jgi:hypothetical protein
VGLDASWRFRDGSRKGDPQTLFVLYERSTRNLDLADMTEAESYFALAQEFFAPQHGLNSEALGAQPFLD